MRAPASLLAILFMLVSTGVRAAEPVRTELPGFSIVLPNGEVMQQSNQPETGTYKLKLPGSGTLGAPYDVLDANKLLPGARQIAVSWLSTRYSYEDWRQFIVGGVLNSLKVNSPRLLREEDLGQGRFLAVIGNDQLPLALVYLPCSQNFSVFVTFAVSTSIDEQIRGARLAADSVVCAATRATPKLEAVVAVPRGFERGPSDVGQIYSTRKGEALMVNYTAQDVQRDRGKFRDVLGGMLASGYGVSAEDVTLEEVPSEQANGAANLNKITMPGELDGAYVGALYCPAQDVTFIIVWTGPNRSDKLAAQRIGVVSCPAPTR